MQDARAVVLESRLGGKGHLKQCASRQRKSCPTWTYSHTVQIFMHLTLHDASVYENGGGAAVRDTACIVLGP